MDDIVVKLCCLQQSFWSNRHYDLICRSRSDPPSLIFLVICIHIRLLNTRWYCGENVPCPTELLQQPKWWSVYPIAHCTRFLSLQSFYQQLKELYLPREGFRLVLKLALASQMLVPRISVLEPWSCKLKPLPNRRCTIQIINIVGNKENNIKE